MRRLDAFRHNRNVALGKNPVEARRKHECECYPPFFLENYTKLYIQRSSSSLFGNWAIGEGRWFWKSSTVNYPSHKGRGLKE
jgi:hypothetical protein